MVYVNENGLLIEDYLSEFNNPVLCRPDYATLDESSFYIIEAVEKDFNEMMMNLGIDELVQLESTGTEMIYEEGRISSLVESATKFIGSIWQKIQGLIRDALDTLEKKAKEIYSNKIKKLATKENIKLKLENLKSDKVYAKTYSYPDGVTAGIIAEIKSADKKIDDLTAKAAAQSGSNNRDKLYSLSDDLKDVVKNAKCKSAKHDSVPKNMQAAYKMIYQGASVECTGSWIKNHFNEMLSEIEKNSKSKAAIKKDYNLLRAHYNGVIANLKALAKGNNRSFEPNAYTKAVSAYKDLANLGVNAENAAISAVMERFRTYSSLVFRVLMTRGAKATNESAAAAENGDAPDSKVEENNEQEVSESVTSTEDRVSSLFNW